MTSLTQTTLGNNNLLHLCVKNNSDVTCAKFILESALEEGSIMFFFTQKNDDGQTALELAYALNKKNFCNLFLEFLDKVAQQTKPDDIGKLLFQEADEKNIPLHSAVLNNSNINIASKLVDMALMLDVERMLNKENSLAERMLTFRNEKNLTPCDLAKLLHKDDFVEFLSHGKTLQTPTFSTSTIEFYYGKFFVKVNGNNILQEHIAAENVNSVKKVVETAKTVDGLLSKMLTHKNFGGKTALEMAKSKEITELLK